MKKYLRLAARRVARMLDKQLEKAREPSIIGRDFVTGLEGLAGIYPSTKISVGAGANGEYVMLGRGVYLGRRVEVEAGKIEIGDDTSLQDGGAIRGDVKIGSHCLFGHNVLVISTSHRFRDNPSWLIRDQDAAYDSYTDPSAAGASIHIDDDCWLGWGCAVMPGVHIGRGAILGANSVVASNVGPYEIHGGVPNRRLGERLAFVPPPSISALDDDCLPYFYAGFCHRRAILKKSRESGLIFARGRSAIVLSQLDGPNIRLKGERCDRTGDLILHFWLNGADAGCHAIPPGVFSLTLAFEPGSRIVRSVPPGLLSHTFLQWQEEAPGAVTGDIDKIAVRYGISSAEIL